ncbi:MAG: amidohydrolase family protein [Planctomycetota bacterium]|nr:amidohydrolase family protein [Planctomycetota bacterium]
MTDRPVILRLDAAAAQDAGRFLPGPVSAIIELWPSRGTPPSEAPAALRDLPTGDLKLLALGRSAEIDHHPASAVAGRTGLGQAVLIPGLVNAHTHLDLTHIGPRPGLVKSVPGAPADFRAFTDLVRAQRLEDESAIEASVRVGAFNLLAGGVVAAGDIAGAPKGRPQTAPVRAMAAAGLAGVSFVEFFAMGRLADLARVQVPAALERLAQDCAGSSVRAGLSPHAPYTVPPAMYRWASDLARAHNLAVSTHAAETHEEARFIAHGDGSFADFLREVKAWDDALIAPGPDAIGAGRSPVEHLAATWLEREAEHRGAVSLVHLNQLSDADIDRLARLNIVAVYCPRASAYFHASESFGAHRYRDLLSAGVPVAVGSDSIINLPPDAHGRASLSTLHDLRLLRARDGADASGLLAMATTMGARALGLDPARFVFREGGALAGICAIACDEPPESPSAIFSSTADPMPVALGRA